MAGKRTSRLAGICIPAMLLTALAGCTTTPELPAVERDGTFENMLMRAAEANREMQAVLLEVSASRAVAAMDAETLEHVARQNTATPAAFAAHVTLPSEYVGPIYNLVQMAAEAANVGPAIVQGKRPIPDIIVRVGPGTRTAIDLLRDAGAQARGAAAVIAVAGDDANQVILRYGGHLGPVQESFTAPYTQGSPNAFPQAQPR